MAKQGRKSTPPSRSAQAKAKGTPKVQPKAPARKPASAPKTKAHVSKKAVKPVVKPLPKHVSRPKPAAKPASKPAVAKSVGGAHKAPPRPTLQAPVVETRVVGKAKPAPAPPPVKRSTYVDAVAQYERGVQFLQARKYRDASACLTNVIEQFPEEKELHERARLYLRVCSRAIEAEAAVPESSDDRVFSATLAINNGALDSAVSILQGVISADPEHDHATYMLGVALALKGQFGAALVSLSRSMALNPENRELASKEPDLDALRHTEEMRALLASPPAPLPRKDKGVSLAKPKKA